MFSFRDTALSESEPNSMAGSQLSDLPTSRTSRRSAAVDSVTLRMFTGLTSRNCPIKSQIGVCARIYRFVTADVMKYVEPLLKK
jgi:hypothetical protein